MIFRRNRWFSMAFGLRAILILQCCVACLLMFNDISARIERPNLFERPQPSGPVAPGDQVRKYERIRTQPSYVERPEIELPEEFAERLQFSVVNSKHFGEVLLLQGSIDAGDAERLTAFLQELEHRPDVIALNSPGGVVYEALLIGKKINEEEFETTVLPGMICVSSCPYIFAAGSKRTAFLGAALGLHQHYYDTPSLLPAFLAVEKIQHGQGITMAYLIEMGIDPSLMLYSLNTPPNDIYVLVKSELLETRLATEFIENQ
ncbi:hypothetical protein E7681_18415 [Thalassobius vesicularis]|uniref:ATP-dependent Clp protease proteolytic subunit n=1 Tax=Thalassobius vesicularis TaxID=1294297 RepID=A0A4S3M6R2_9RHOB|nr:hypothetical protein [Thalassobius vesicularis]THD71187.1 hypothetical protein E7681_18415 [Thalassobius vesicularis]